MIAAVIVEYNPLHNGHIYHLDQTRKIMNEKCPNSEHFIIAVMSGNFCQRGEATVLNKYTRTRHAILSGADMVVELPSIYATSSAEYFAKGAIEVISKIKGVDLVCFGSECGNIDELKHISDISESEEYNSLVKEYVSAGLSYPKSTSKALEDIGIANTDNYSLPNNTLAIEYIRQARKIGLSAELCTITRQGGGYNDTAIDNEFVSASAIRNSINNKSHSDISSKVPDYVYADLLTANVDYDKFFGIIGSKLLDTNEVYEDNEGIINRIKKAMLTANNYEELVELAHTKRYTKSKIKRVLVHIALSHKPSDIEHNLGNVTVLGVKQSSKQLLSLIAKSDDNFHNQMNDYANNIYNILSTDKITSNKMIIV